MSSHTAPAPIDSTDALPGGWTSFEVPGTPLAGRVVGGAAVLETGWRTAADEDHDADEVLDAAFDAIEAVVVAHAAAGIDVSSQDYGSGIVDAVEAILAHLG
jgi:hypothetical protein